MAELERRVVTQALECRADGDAKKLGGYAALFDSETVIAGAFREVIKRGAFTDAVTRDDVRATFNHDPNFVLGRTTSGTLTIAEDERGLRYDVTPPDTTWARDLMTSVSRGDVTQSSFAFRVTRDAWPAVKRGELPLRSIEAVELYDVSPVTYPAYESTTVAVRAQAASVVAAAESSVAAKHEHARRHNRIVRAAREASAFSQ
jgi:HK97 family phage prohead protease